MPQKSEIDQPEVATPIQLPLDLEIAVQKGVGWIKKVRKYNWDTMDVDGINIIEIGGIKCRLD